MTEKRKYEQKVRAERQEETRRRIAEATAALHAEIGPARTTISAIAERAGVERLTVYKHFPEESELFRACQQHFLSCHPVPDATLWSDCPHPEDRLRVALTALYAYYDETEGMTANVLHDASLLPPLASTITGRDAYFGVLHADLAAGWGEPPDARVLVWAAVGHAIDFETWRSLVRRQGLTSAQAVDLMVYLVSALAREHAS